MNNKATSLYRPHQGRWLAGVAAGLSLRFGAPVALVRVAFVLLCFAGGLGALLYLAGWLLIPSEGETDSIVQGWLDTDQARRWVGVVLVGLAVIILGSATGLIRGDLAFAVVLIGIGVMLYRGDLGRGDHRPETPQATNRETSPEGAAAAAAVPPAPAAAPAPPKERSYLGRVCVGIAVIALGVMGLFDEVIVGFRPEFHHYVALAVGVIGVGVVVGAWFGRPAGLVILGVFLLPVLLLSRLVAVGGVDLMSFEFTSVGSVLHRPGSVEEIREEYELEVGGLTIDLRDVDFAERTVSVETQVGIGSVLVRLPEDVAAEVSGQVGMGTLQVGDLDRDGVGVEADVRMEGSAGTLVLDAHVGIGEIEVRAWPVGDRPPLPDRRGGNSRRGIPDEEALEPEEPRGPVSPSSPRTGIPDEEALEQEYRIRDRADLQDEYTLATGSLRLDLGRLVLEDARRVPINVGRGEVWVTVPPDVSLWITTQVDRGRLTMFDDVWEGSNLKSTYSTQITGAPRLTLDIRLGEGSLTVEEER